MNLRTGVLLLLQASSAVTTTLHSLSSPTRQCQTGKPSAPNTRGRVPTRSWGGKTRWQTCHTRYRRRMSTSTISSAP